MGKIVIEHKDYMTFWFEHFFQNSMLIDNLPFGWCVYREVLDWN